MNYFLVITNSKGESRVVPIEDVSDIPVEAGDDIVVMDEKGNPVDVSLRPDGEDLVIDFKDGTKAVLNDFYANEEGEEPITISLNPTMPDSGDYEFNSQSGNLPNSDKFSLMRYSSTGYINFSQQLDELDIGALLGSLGGGSGLSSGGGGGGGNEAPLDLAPQAAPDSANAVEDGAAVRIDLLSNDTDPLGRGLEIQSIGGVDVVPGSTVTLPSGSIVTLLRNGEVEFEPGPGFDSLQKGEKGTESFVYSVRDAGGNIATSQVTVTVKGVNDAPDANADEAFTGEDTPVTVRVLENDYDPDVNDTLRVTDVSTPSGGSVVINADNTLTFDPTGDFDYLGVGESESVTVAYEITDSNGATATSTATFLVFGANDVPVAVDDSATTNQDTSLAIDVTTNDTELDVGDEIIVEGIDQPVRGSVSVNSDNRIVFDPGSDFDYLGAGESEAVTFDYLISDGNGGTDTATVTVVVQGVNDPTETTPDEATTDEDTAVVIDVLANDSDPDNNDNPLTVASVDDSGLPGDASVTNNGTDVTFHPGTAFNDLGVGETETVTFTYTTNTGATETVTVTVTGTNDGPTAVNDTGAVGEDATTTIDLLDNDSDPDTNDNLSVVSINGIAAGGTITLPSGALLTVNDDGTVVYDTNGQFDSLDETQSATDTFTYTISDGNGGTDTATATVTINGTNDPTVTSPDEATTDEGNPVTIDVLDNDEDPDDTLTVASVDDSGLPGDASVTNNGTDVTFHPGTAFNDLGVGETETVTFTYTTNTGATETVTVTVTGTNDGPTAVNDTGATDQDTAILINVTGNDSDPDTNDSLLVQSVSQPARGSVSITGGGVRFDPGSDFDYLDAGESTSVTFDYVVTDGNGGSDSATVTVTVTGADDPLVAVTDFGTTSESSPVTINVLDNDSDPDTTDTPLVVSAVSNPPLGTVTHNGTSVLFDPGTDFEFLTVGESQDVTFTYTVTNQDGETEVQTVTVTVTGENDAPVTHADTLHTIEGYGQAVDVVANDDDAESSQLTVSHINGAAVTPNAPVALESGVLVSLMEDGRIYLNPNGRYADLDFGETAVETFTYTVTDSEGGTATETVTAVIEGTSKEEVLSGAYQVLSDQLYEIQLDPSDESIVYVPIGDPLPFNFNSIAFNANDNLIYATAQGSDAGLGVSSKDLIQISPLTGQIVGNLGQMLNDQGEVINDFAGVINSDINVYYVNGTADSGGNKTYAIDLDPASPTYLQVTGIGDLPGADYGVDPNTGLLWSVHGTTTYSLDPTSGVLTTYSNNGGLQDDGVSPVSGTFGSIFSDGDGNIQATSNSGYGFYRVDTTNGNLIRISDAPATSSNDATGTLDTALPSAQPFLFLDVDGSTGAPTTNDAVRVYDPQGSPISISDSDVGIADLDGNTISSAEIILTNRFSGDEFVVGALPPGITSSVEVRGGLLVLSLTGDASQDDYETAIAAISFQNVGASTVLSDPREISVTVTDVNDVVSNPSTSLIFIGEGGGIAEPRDTRDEEGSTPDMVVSHEDDNDPATGGVTINVLRNDSDSPTQVIGITQPASGRGMVTNNGDGTLTFNPGSDYQYLDDGETAVTSFTYETNTGEVETVTVIVHGENDAIIATADAAGVMSNQVSTIDVLANDRDPDTFDQPLSIASTTQPARGTVTHDGSVVFFDPGTDFNHLLPGQSEVVNFIYVVNNSSGEVENETVTVTVTKPAAVPPVVIDMDGDGAEFDSVENGILADVDGDGQLEQTAWADEDDAVLVYDKNNNNEVDDRSEYAFADYGEEGATDLEGLRHFDSNEDLILDANDAEFDSFKLWQDRDGDGQVGEGEMLTLEEAGIESIELTSDGQSYITADGDVKVHGEATIHYADGTKGIAADAEFSFEELEGENDSLEIIANDGQVVDVNASGESEEPVGADLLAGNAASDSGANGGEESHGEFVEGGAIPATSVEDDIAANDAAMG
ncbi:MAG: Ig-like domain-containing protein [Verrucomicrobiales bacterium]|nr:Ig-like domain-containing protein [Verrucomicrobiales bacterium]